MRLYFSLQLRFRHLSLVWMTLCVAIIATFAKSAETRQVSEWTVAEVLSEAGRYQASPAATTNDDRHALAKRAVHLLLDAEVQANSDQATLQHLVAAASPALASLAEEERAQLEKSLTFRSANGDIPFEQLQARVALLNGLGKHGKEAVEAVEEWLDTRDIAALSIDEANWCLIQSLPSRQSVRKFSVVWTGQLSPPRSGDYAFSVSPINVNRNSRAAVQHTVKVILDDKQVLSVPSSQENDGGKVPMRRGGVKPIHWNPTAQPVSLTAKDKIPIRVEMTFECSQPSLSDAASVVLAWEGPGISRQTIPVDSFSGPNGEKGGLKQVVRWMDGERSELAESVVPNIDAIWSTPTIIGPTNLKLINKLSDRLWKLSTEPEYLASCSASDKAHVLTLDAPNTDFLGSGRRQYASEIIAANHELLKRLDARQIVTLYQKLRFGAEEPALEMLGAWMEVHADLAAATSVDFYAANRLPFSELGRCLGTQLPEHLEAVQERYLTAQDGGCVLPAAYALTYGYLTLAVDVPPLIDASGQLVPSQLLGWSKQLEQTLGNKELTGDLRINWLLARAHFEEARNATHVQLAAEPPLAGKQWLDEATLTAESPEVQQRLERELIARHVGVRDWQRARSVLDRNPELSDAAALREAIDHAKKEATAFIAADRRSALQETINEFMSREEQAAARDDKDAVARYQARIKKIQSLQE